MDSAGSSHVSFFSLCPFRLFSLSVVDEEMLLGVCPKWTVSVRCVRHCDVHVLHQILFIAAINEMRGSEEEREVQCLLALLKGRWQEERAVLAWPLFHGFDLFCAVRMTLRPGHFSSESQTPTANHRFQTAAATKKQLRQAFNPLDARVEDSAKCSTALPTALSNTLPSALPNGFDCSATALSNALWNSMPSDMHMICVLLCRVECSA